MNSNINYKILHDTGKTLCFIGKSHGNIEMYRHFNASRPCENLMYEDVLTKDQAWIDDRQFIFTQSNIAFKKTITQGLAHLNPNYFSVVSTFNHIGFDVKIGRGSYIGPFTTIIDGAEIGDHVVLTSHNNLSYFSIVKDFCHIGPYTQILIATVGNGCFIGARTSISGKVHEPVVVADYCNFLLGSVVTKNVIGSGTYYNNRRVDQLTSLEKKID